MRISDWSSDVCSSDLMFDGTTVALADVAEIRKKVPGATVNDVVLTTVGGALRKYLAQHKDLPKESLVAVAPINLRGKEKGTGKASTPGNQVSAMSVPVRTDIADPLERLRSEEHTSELQSLMRISYAVFCLKTKKTARRQTT